MSIEEIIKALESKYDWMKITKHDDGTYMIQDTRFGSTIPFNIWKDFITESELLEELKHHIAKLMIPEGIKQLKKQYELWLEDINKDYNDNIAEYKNKGITSFMLSKTRLLELVIKDMEELLK